ncbi:uncharacterized protein FFB20_12110 [Fusarium fujikuroi]|nr:uncharacterized protein FFB20_12110 [Fusarium fujikuroi]
MPLCKTVKAKRERLACEAEEAYLAEEVEAERIAVEEAKAKRIAAKKAKADRTAAKKAKEKRIAFKKKLEADLTPKKRKAVSNAISITSGSSSSLSDSKEDPMDTLKDFTEKECYRLSRFFYKVTNHKKKKKKSKGKGKSKSKKAKGTTCN